MIHVNDTTDEIEEIANSHKTFTLSRQEYIYTWLG